MTYFELLQESPGLFILLTVVSLIVTLVAYGAFPLIFSRIRKSNITKKKYYTLCYCINFAVMGLFIAINGGASSGGPYLLWTWVFSSSGLKTLKSRGVLGESQTTSYSNPSSIGTATVNHTVNNKICFCRKCGNKLHEGANFCNKCGTKVITDEAEGE